MDISLILSLDLEEVEMYTNSVTACRSNSDCKNLLDMCGVTVIGNKRHSNRPSVRYAT
jgi:hypothetical protein